MMTTDEFFDELINENMILAVLSGCRRKDAPSRVRIRPVEVKGEILYQASVPEGAKMLHRNYRREELVGFLKESLDGTYSQLQVQGRQADGGVLVSKKGKHTVKIKPHEVKENAKILSHNRVKQYILPQGKPVPFLVDLGVMTREGRVREAAYDKYRQINRFLEFIQDVLPKLPKDREITIVDFGCGKSYLTFAMYYFFRELKGYQVKIIGLDLKEDVIRRCSRLAEEYGYDNLQFLQGDIAGYEGLEKADMVVTLHACDTATDFALAKAVQWDAKVILSVPCCQHELNGKIRNDLLAPVLKYGILKERMSALITDGIRANLLESAGYSVQILEFIDMEHTPKNLLIRAVKTGKKQSAEPLGRMTEAIRGELTLERLLYPQGLPGAKGV
ncbi:MAG: class I SAM-dependent methyltransferase [Blautia sp.]